MKTLKANGYPLVELHTVTTEDGYILSIHRIPPKQPTTKVVLLMHGMGTTGLEFLELGPKQAMGKQQH